MQNEYCKNGLGKQPHSFSFIKGLIITGFLSFYHFSIKDIIFLFVSTEPLISIQIIKISFEVNLNVKEKKLCRLDALCHLYIYLITFSHISI